MNDITAQSQTERYRDLTKEEITLINDVRRAGAGLKDLVARIQEIKDADQRWVIVGKTDLQRGLMSLTRAIAKPDF